MKMQQVLSSVNQIEKAKFINFLDKLCCSAKSNNKVLSDALDGITRQIKDAPSAEISRLFEAVKNDFKLHLTKQISMSGASLKLLVNILSRDGNGIARISWVEQLYTNEWQRLEALAKDLTSQIEEAADLNDFSHGHRLRIYQDCLNEAYFNDARTNRDENISDDERSVLNVLAQHLHISSDEVAAIEHLVDPVRSGKDTVESCLQELRESGVVFIRRKTGEVITPDETVHILNKIQGKKIADKHLVRILRCCSDPELSNILKSYGKRIRGVSRTEKISTCLQSGLNVESILSKDIFSDTDTLNERKNRLKTLIHELNIQSSKIGSTVEERIQVIIHALCNASDAEFELLSASSYKELFEALKLHFSSLSLEHPNETLEQRLQREFELETIEDVDTDRLRALSISPVDVLYTLSNDEIKSLRDSIGLSKRGDARAVILEAFENATDKLIEQLPALSRRDIKHLRESGIDVSESDIGIKFEESVKTILESLGLDVDEDLRKEINTSKDKVDIILAISDDDIIIGEAKTCKNGDYAKYSTTSRQVKAYANRCESYGKRVAQVLIVAPSFSNDFVLSAEMDPEINISLLEADGLKQIYDAFRSKRNAKFSPKLLSKGGLLKAELIAKSL